MIPTCAPQQRARSRPFRRQRGLIASRCAGPESAPSASNDGDVATAWPLLHQVAAGGLWRGSMHYATGVDALTPAPFVLQGTTQVPVRCSMLWSGSPCLHVRPCGRHLTSCVA